MSDGYQMELAAASRWANRANRRRIGLQAAHEQDADVLVELLQTYLRLKSSKGAHIGQRTLGLYAESVRRFLAYAGPPATPQLSLLQLEADDLDYWIYQLQGQGLRAASIQRHLHGVRNLMKALVWAGVLRTDPSQGVRVPKAPTPAHNRSALTAAQLSSLLTLPAQLHADEPSRAARDRAILLLGGRLGLRASELVGLNCEDVDVRHAVLRVLGKGQKWRQLPLTAAVASDLRAWLTLRQSLPQKTSACFVSFAARNRGGRLTPKGVRDVVGSYYQALGLPLEISGVHTLRRTAGTQLYKATRDLHVVADILGHSSISTTAIYAKMDEEVRREALEQAEGLGGL